MYRTVPVAYWNKLFVAHAVYSSWVLFSQLLYTVAVSVRESNLISRLTWTISWIAFTTAIDSAVMTGSISRFGPRTISATVMVIYRRGSDKNAGQASVSALSVYCKSININSLTIECALKQRSQEQNLHRSSIHWIVALYYQRSGLVG